MVYPRNRPSTIACRATFEVLGRLLAAAIPLLVVPHVLHAEVAAQGVRWVSVVGGPVVLTVGASGLLAGEDPLPATDESTGLEWRTGSGNQKIMVSTTAPGQSFGLRIEAMDVAGMGVPQGAVDLQDGMFAQDLLRNLNTTPGPANGSCTVRLTAVATADQGNSVVLGLDLHQITFTMTDQ